MTKIDFNKKDDSFVKLFDETAQEWAIAISEERNSAKSSQMRNFYEKVMEWDEKASKMPDDQFREDVLPFVKMLNSKVAYAKTRGTVDNKFVQMMNDCIRQVNSASDLRIFKLFFEAVIGFYPKK